MKDEKIIIVNDKDRIIEYKNRSEILKKDIYRVSGLWIKNSKGQILLAQRAFDKKNDPGKWGPAVAGTVEEGETYESNIYKEAQEEIGLEGISFSKLEKIRYSKKYNFFCQWFRATVDKELSFFVIQEKEVEKIKWFNTDELQDQFKKHPEDFIWSMKDHIELFLK